MALEVRNKRILADEKDLGVPDTECREVWR